MQIIVQTLTYIRVELISLLYAFAALIILPLVIGVQYEYIKSKTQSHADRMITKYQEQQLTVCNGTPT